MRLSVGKAELARACNQLVRLQPTEEVPPLSRWGSPVEVGSKREPPGPPKALTASNQRGLTIGAAPRGWQLSCMRLTSWGFFFELHLQVKKKSPEPFGMENLQEGAWRARPLTKMAGGVFFGLHL